MIYYHYDQSGVSYTQFHINYQGGSFVSCHSCLCPTCWCSRLHCGDTLWSFSSIWGYLALHWSHIVAFHPPVYKLGVRTGAADVTSFSGWAVLTRDQNHSFVTKSGTFTIAPAGVSVLYYKLYHTWGSVRRNDFLNSSNLMSENWFRPTRFENERLCENNRPPEYESNSIHMMREELVRSSTVLVKEWFPALWWSIVLLFSAKMWSRW